MPEDFMRIPAANPAAYAQAFNELRMWRVVHRDVPPPEALLQRLREAFNGESWLPGERAQVEEHLKDWQ